jgi:hypothetical protein
MGVAERTFNGRRVNCCDILSILSGFREGSPESATSRILKKLRWHFVKICFQSHLMIYLERFTKATGSNYQLLSPSPARFSRR